MQYYQCEKYPIEFVLSENYLIKKFKRIVGMTPHQFCVQNRIRKAQSLLDAEQVICGVAAEMGFYDQSHFDKAFQKIVGISPSEYVDSKKVIRQSA